MVVVGLEALDRPRRSVVAAVAAVAVVRFSHSPRLAERVEAERVVLRSV
jgi:hypothetical protein